jgi:hypothetical protein
MVPSFKVALNSDVPRLSLPGSKENRKKRKFSAEEIYRRVITINNRYSENAPEKSGTRRTLENAKEIDPGGDFFGFENIHDLGDIGLDMRGRVVIKEEEKIQKEAAHLGR